MSNKRMDGEIQSNMKVMIGLILAYREKNSKWSNDQTRCRRREKQMWITNSYCSVSHLHYALADTEFQIILFYINLIVVLCKTWVPDCLCLLPH